jgi:hypothetical protein
MLACVRAVGKNIFQEEKGKEMALTAKRMDPY